MDTYDNSHGHDSKKKLKNEYRRAVRDNVLHPTLRRIKHRELGAGLSAAEVAIKLYPGRLKAQMDALIDRLEMRAGTGRERRMSLRTVASYRERLAAVVSHMHAQNMRPNSIMEITTRQVERLFETLVKEGYSASHLIGLNTVLRRLGVWLGKPDLCPPMKFLTEDRRKIQRSTYATMPKDWSIAEGKAQSVIEEVGAICEYTACLLKMSRAFGCRVEELLSARPAMMIRGDSLHVIEGTKGGRSRVVPIETDEQKAVLAQALELASKNPNGLLSPVGRLTMKQAKARFYKQMRKAGVTKVDKGLVVHGLRHGYARAFYLRATGVEPPVRGGPQISPELDKKVRMDLTERLGHSRKDVVSSYIGTHKGMSRHKSSNMKWLIEKLDKDEVLIQLALEMGAKGVYVLGNHAEGKSLEPDDCVLIGLDMPAGPLCQKQKEMTSRVKVLLDCGSVMLVPMEMVDLDMARLDLLGLVDHKPNQNIEQQVGLQ